MAGFRHAILIVAVGAVVALANLGGPRLWDRDEPRNAGCTREMLARGDWITPVFDGELRTHKPILLYWFMMTAYALFGVNEFAARFWSAIAAVGTALVTYDLGRRLVSPITGLWAAAILLTTLMFGVAARAATPDALLIFWSTAAIAAYVAGLAPSSEDATYGLRVPGRDGSPSWPHAALAYACMGMAVLAKGPIGVLLPSAVLGLYLLIAPWATATSTQCLDSLERSTSWWSRVGSRLRWLAPRHVLRVVWSMRPLTAVAVVLLVALPWYVAVATRTDGAWVRGFLWDHNLGRATRSLEGHRGSLFYYYPLALLVGFFPWSVFAVPVAWDVVAQLRRRSAARDCLVLALCWISVYVGLFSLAQTKLPSYITPCYPAVALLVSVFIQSWCTRATVVPRVWPIAAFCCLGLVSLGMLVAIPILVPRYLPGEMGLLGLAAIPLVTAAGGLWYLRRDQPWSAAVTSAVGACGLCAGLLAIGAARVDRHQTFHTLVAYLQEQGPSAEVGTLGVSEPSWVFYLGHPLDRLGVPPTGARAAASPGSLSATTVASLDQVRCGMPPLQKPTRDAWQYLREQPRRYAITSQRYLESVGGPPHGIEVVARTPYFLRNDTLLLLAARWWAPP